MTPELATVIAGIVGVVVAIALSLWWWINRTPRITREADGVLPLFGSGYDPDAPPAPRPTPPAAPAVQAPAPERPVAARTPTEPPMQRHAPAPAPAPSSAPAARTVSAPPPAAPERPAPVIRTFETAAKPVPPAGAPVVSSAGVPGTMVEGQLLRFSVPAEGTLQFLPGRLEIAAGLDAGREIRFVNVPGPDGTVVTFGRSEGELYRHIQLRDQTVSRAHARMRFVGGQWQLLNLSQTNPVVHNGKVLQNGEEHGLVDGDRIEMGEVFFTFRSR